MNLQSLPKQIKQLHVLSMDDDKMALKMAGSKVFSDKPTLLALATSPQFNLRHAEKIIDKTAQGILDYLQQSDAVQLFDGLKQSIQQSVDTVMSKNYNPKNYRHDKKRKFE